jgi:8-oxo-dGTP pyrophosphatase MutT (NUDIX family)
MRTKIKKLILKLGYSIYKIVRTPVKWYWKVFRIQTRGVRVMLIHQEKIVLVRHWYNSLWVMPGGGIHAYETPEQAAIREIQEELGFTIKQLDYCLGVYSNNKEGKNDTVYCYVVELSEQILFTKKRFNIEIADIIWGEFSELPSGTSFATKTRIKEYLSKDITHRVRPWS